MDLNKIQIWIAKYPSLAYQHSATWCFNSFRGYIQKQVWIYPWILS